MGNPQKTCPACECGLHFDNGIWHCPQCRQEHIEGDNGDLCHICFSCKCGLHYESIGTRDIEAMGGICLEYMRCPKCGQGYNLIEGNVSMNEDSPPIDDGF